MFIYYQSSLRYIKPIETKNVNCKKTHTLIFPERIYNKKVLTVNENTFNFNGESNSEFITEPTITKERLDTITEENNDIKIQNEDGEKEKNLQLNIEYFDVEDDEKSTEVLMKSLMDLTQKKEMNKLSIKVPRSLEKDLKDLIDILEKEDPKSDVLKQCYDGLKLLNTLKSNKQL